MFKKKYLILFLSLFGSFLFSKKMIIKKQNFTMNAFKDKYWINAHAWFKIVPLQEILERNSQISYLKVSDKVYFDCPEFSIAPKFPHKGYFYELFILNIPNGQVQSLSGHVFIDGKLSDEMARGDRFECLIEIPNIKDENVKKISGRVAVIAQHGAGGKWANYYHALYEVFGRLAILEIAGIEYDWLYIPLDKKYVREFLELWGIDFSKIIAPDDEKFCIQADELIVPSMVINTSCGHDHAGNFQHPVTSMYVREKLLKKALEKNIDVSLFSKRVFISRRDVPKMRRILNEDEIFKLFESMGFVSYELSNLSVLEQIILLHNADIVVSEQGSGLANTLFCKPGTLVIEIFQKIIDNCFWWISNMCNLQYFPIKTLPVDVDYFVDWRLNHMNHYFVNVLSQTNIPLDEIKRCIEFLKENNEI